MRADERFHVFVILPLFPAGNVNDLATRYVLEWVYKTTHSKAGSIIPTLEREFPGKKVDHYISFYNLRNHGLLNGRLTTQQIYVHSKLLISDDRVVIIGSANISTASSSSSVSFSSHPANFILSCASQTHTHTQTNGSLDDRSLCGDRDSELAALIADRAETDSVMDGHPYRAACFARRMRLSLWSLLLGTDCPVDPVSLETIGLWHSTAANNAAIYSSVFSRIEDNLQRVEEWNPGCWSAPSSLALDQQRLQQIRGFLVPFRPFLAASRLHPRMWEKEWFVDVDTFL